MTNDDDERRAPLAVLPDDLEARRRRLVWGERVRFERLLRKWTQHDLARVAGLTQPQVSRIERGARQVTHATLTRVARAFVLPAGELFPYDDAEPEPLPAPKGEPPELVAAAS